METVDDNKLARLAQMYSKEMAVQTARLREAVDNFDEKKSFSAWLQVRNIAERINELMILRNAMRTHDPVFREEFPDAADVLDQP